MPSNAPVPTSVDGENFSREDSPPKENSPVSDRRNSEARRSPRARAPLERKVKEQQHVTIIPSDWWYVAIFLAATVPASAIHALGIPPLSVWILAALGAATAWYSRTLLAKERKDEFATFPAKAIAWGSILIPVLCFGFVIGYLSVNSLLAWPWAVAGMLSFNILCLSVLTKRALQQQLVLLLGWLPIALQIGELAAITAFIALLIMVFFSGRYMARKTAKYQERAQLRERERNRAEDILRDYEETGQGWFWETDRRGLVTYVSPSVLTALDRSETQVAGRPFIDLFDVDDGAESERTLSFHLSARSSFQELGAKVATEGEARYWSISGRPAYDGFRNFLGFRGSGTDLTEKRRSEENVTRLAQYDSLTGLANRFQMQQSLEKILEAHKEQDRECAVFLLDLDRFKHVNDTFGHPAGDALLKQVSQRLVRTVGNQGRVGRLGGDEFEVIMPGRPDRTHLAQLAQEVIHALSQPYSIDGNRIIIGASVGVAVAPEDGTTTESIIRNSDLALYAAKDGGRGRFHFYSNDLHSAAEERNTLEQDLRDAIATGGLDLYYQPVVDANSNVIAGFEALLRWNHPQRGWLSPAKFVPIAEDTGLINAIGEWAIRTACDDLAKWPGDIRCAVNVSPLQFANPQLPSIITNAIARTGIHPSRLELEITESVFLNDDEGTDAMFAALKRVGVRLALDDFGTGYSSLGYLKKAPFDKIKIDQSFVRGATEPGSRNGAIITSITSLAKSLGMDTTAEGVETFDELELVRSLGCSHVQGYIYSKAVDDDGAHKLMLAGPEIEPQGPRSSRAPRSTMLRKVMLEHDGQIYKGVIRNMSEGGAMVEGLWNVPEGTPFNIAFSKSLIVPVVSVWGHESRMGVKFAQPVDLSKLDQAALQRPETQNEEKRRSA